MYALFFTVGQKLPSVFVYNVISYLAVINRWLGKYRKEMVRKVYNSLLKYVIRTNFLNNLAL